MHKIKSIGFDPTVEQNKNMNTPQIIQKCSKRKRKKKKYRWIKYKTNSEMIDINPNFPIMPLSEN